MNFYKLIRPILFSLDAETAHHIALNMASFFGKFSSSHLPIADPVLTSRYENLEFKSPIGLAAGLDKNGVALNFWPNLGFGFVEMGTVTLLPQEGQKRPRMFRIPEMKALINRLGFPNEGAEAISDRLKTQRKLAIPLGINIGKSKVVVLEDAVENYEKTFEWLYPYGDYFTINVSSPNTPDLRKMQEESRLAELLQIIKQKNQELSKNLKISPKPLFVKIAPDLTQEQLDAVVQCAISHRFTGIIATNTQPVEQDLREKWGEGGLSGQPLFGTSTEIIRLIRKRAGNKLMIIGCGGIFSAEDVYAKIKAGANLVQLYTALVYEGPGLVKRLNRDLAQLLKRDGVKNIQDIVGVETF